MGCGAVVGIRDTSHNNTNNYHIGRSSSSISSRPPSKWTAFNLSTSHLPSSDLVRIKCITSMSEAQDIVDSKTIPPDGKNSFKTLFCKENVYVHPSGSRDGGIPGYLSLIDMDDGGTAFAWTPYYMLRGDESSFVNVQSPENRTSSASLTDSNNATIPLPTCTTDLYAVRVPLSEIQSFRKMSSAMGMPNVIVVLQGGIALPPYYFHTGGVREFLDSVEEYATLIKSPDDTNLFFVHDISYPLAQSLSLEKQLQKQEIQAANSLNDIPQHQHQQTQQQQQESNSTDSPAQSPSMPPPPIHGKDISWSILENFAKITRFARMAEKTLFTDGNRTPPPPSVVPRGVRSEAALPENANLPSIHHSTSVGSFEVLGQRPEDASPQSERRPSSSPSSSSLFASVNRGQPLSQEQWIACFDNEGRIPEEKEQEIRKQIFYGGIEPELRQEVWKYLLGYFSFNSTFDEREQLQQRKGVDYNKLKSQWSTIDAEQESHFSKFRSRRHRIEKDVVRTDRTHPFYSEEGGQGLQMLQSILMTYAFFNFDLGYVQGMSDLLAPILVNMQDEVAAYWCFKNLMDRIGNNFHKDQNGMHTQLVQLANLLKCMDPELHEYLKERSCTNMFFCFRWVLIQFKREFPFDTVMSLWEALWSQQCGKNFHLFVCVAIMMKKRTEIIGNQMEFDDILKFLNSMSMNMNLQEYLIYAELLYNNFTKKTDPQISELRDFIMAN